VQVDWVGKLPEHLILSAVRLDPEKIQVIGGKGILHNMSTVYTETVPLDNINKSGTMTVNLALNPASLKVAEGSKDKVTVTYVVKERSH
jgi:YbbR domain-containing protein